LNSGFQAGKEGILLLEQHLQPFMALVIL
jgi:hypothetical protein